METRKLAIYTMRNKVFVDPDSELINPSHEVNRAFLEKFGGEKTNVPTVKLVVPARDVDEPDETTDESGLMSLSQSEKEYQHYRAIRNRKAVELADIEIAKKQGVVIPSAFINPLFMQHNQSILTEMNNMMSDGLRELAKKYSIPNDKVVEVKGSWVSQLNEAIERAKKATAKGVVSIVENYIEAK